jgi:ubiquinone/menaquinone biosynthesis C-methylase UbiE
MNKTTSWGGVAGWYDDLLEKEGGTYQREVILPNLDRLLEIKRGDLVLDLACGQGFFARAFAKLGAKVIAADISKELITLAEAREAKDAETKNGKSKPSNIHYHVAPAEQLSFIEDHTIDKCVIVLAIQNIENIHEVFRECARVMKPNGKLYVVLNHPAFRVPKMSSWGTDPVTKAQYRRIDEYLSERRVKIQMHPGANPDAHTVSFHRPLQSYVKAITKAGFMLSRLEEWNSHKESEPGPHAEEENRIRKEIPIFLMMEATRVAQ